MDWNPPPALHFSERPKLVFDREWLVRSCRDEAAVCFIAEGGSVDQTRSVPDSDGSLLMETRLEGVVETVDEDSLTVTRGGETCRVRYLLPSAISLAPLLDSYVNIAIDIRFSALRRPTIDATIADREGRPLLWALDGLLPPDRLCWPIVRMSHAASTHRLIFPHGHGLAAVAPAETAVIETATGPATVVGVRIREDDIGFLVIWD